MPIDEGWGFDPDSKENKGEQMKAGDWVILDLNVGQIKEIRENGCASFSDGFFETSGMLVDRFRPLTLRSKRTVETFEIYYNRLKQINGEAGFNYPRISQYFAQLALNAIDGDEKDQTPYDKAKEFIEDARNYKPVIQGIPLFRPKTGF